MDAFELNKWAGAVLSALLVIFASKTMLDIKYREHKPEKAGWALPITEAAPVASKGPAAPFDAKAIVALLPKDGKNGTGPNLWGIVGRTPGTHAGFPYSEPMKAKGGTWDYEHLAAYLHDPKSAIPGNKMAFPGIRDNAELADVIVYLRKLSDNPPPLPQ
jgi:cytochrome c